MMFDADNNPNLLELEDKFNDDDDDDDVGEPLNMSVFPSIGVKSLTLTPIHEKICKNWERLREDEMESKGMRHL